MKFFLVRIIFSIFCGAFAGNTGSRPNQQNPYPPPQTPGYATNPSQGYAAGYGGGQYPSAQQPTAAGAYGSSYPPQNPFPSGSYPPQSPYSGYEGVGTYPPQYPPASYPPDNTYPPGTQQPPVYAPPPSGFNTPPYARPQAYGAHANINFPQTGASNYYGGAPSSSMAHGNILPPEKPPVPSNSGKDYQGQPTIVPNPRFNPRETADRLRNAMKGFGCDKDQIIDALCTITNAQRQAVIVEYHRVYRKNLLNELRRELSGDFEEVIMALMERPEVYDAKSLHKATQGLGTDEADLVEILVTRGNAQIYAIRNAYRQQFRKDLEADLKGDTSGPFRNLLVILCQGRRDESWAFDPTKAQWDARQLWRDGEGRFGTKSSTFITVLATQNFVQLREVFNNYDRIASHPIEVAIEHEFSRQKDSRLGFLAIIKCVRSRDNFFAERLHQSMKGLGTRDNDLIRLLVTRCEIDLLDIQHEFQVKYGKPLEQAIIEDCRGAYKKALLTLVRGNYNFY